MNNNPGLEDKTRFLNKLKRLKELRTLKAQRDAQPAVSGPKMSAGQAALESTKQGVTRGFSDEIGGLVDVALSKTGTLFTGGNPNPYEGTPAGTLYAQGRDEERAKFSKALKDQPTISNLAQFGSAALTSVATPGGILGLMGEGALQGAGTADTLSDVPMNAAMGAGIGAVAGGIANKVSGLGNKALETMSEATPAVSTAKKIAQIGTGIPDEALPKSLTAGPRPNDWFFNTVGSKPKVYDDGILPQITETGKSLSLPVTAALDMTGIGAVGQRLSRSVPAQKIAQKGLDVAAPALKAVDKGIQSGADLILKQLNNLPPKYQGVIQKAAAQGSRQLAITHFLLSNQDPEYQSATSNQK